MNSREKEIFKILDRKVFFVRKATEQERQVFSGKEKEGCFTFALESGQKFVANFSEKEVEKMKYQTITFRPLNRMIKGLKEFSWTKLASPFVSRNIKDEYKFADGVSEEEKRAIIYLLHPNGTKDPKEIPNSSLMEKALSVSIAYFNTLEAHKNLQNLLIPEIQKIKIKTR